jgi:hypothetical protein
MQSSADARTSLAVSRGAVTTTEFVTLTDEKGARLPLDKGDHQLIMLTTPPCCGHAGTRPVQPPRLTMFETSEHILIPYGLNMQLEGGVGAAHAVQLTLTPNFHLTYGQIIALGGDFYADPNQPVCDLPPEQRGPKFAQNFESLANSGQEANAIMRVAKRFEFDPIDQAIKKRWSPSGVFVHNASQGWGLLSDSDRAYDGVTGGVDGGKSGRYLNIAFSNFDHFGTDAVACYLAGHVLAQQTAVKASQMPVGSDPRKIQLQRAYAINAFADHFLTDLFAAGHMRTPRRALFKLADNYLTQAAAGLLAQRMHDEDNKFGLWVQNRVGDKWVAFGDKRYRDRLNAGNRKVVKKAVQRSMDEVWEAFSTGRIRNNDSDVLTYVANLVWEIGNEPTASQHRDDRHNWAPLFWRRPSDGNVMRRNDLFNPGDRSFGPYGGWWDPTVWGISTTIAQIKASGRPPLMPDAEYTKGGFPPQPDEAGPSGEVGWPAGPTSVVGVARAMTGVTGPELRNMQPSDWVVDGAPGPTIN